MVLLDVRDYNISYKTPIEEAYNIPSAYLKRYYSELPAKDLVLATNLPKSIQADVRFLKRKGFHVVGILDESKKAKQEELATCC